MHPTDEAQGSPPPSDANVHMARSGSPPWTAVPVGLPADEVSPTSTPAAVDAPQAKPMVLPAVTADDLENVRRPSIQFLPHRNAQLPKGEPKRGRSGSRRRMSSPPPPPVFESRVSFDTWERQPKDETSFTLSKKHKDYAYTKRSRTFLCGLDSNDYSEYALEWLIDELVDDGDEVVCLRVVDPGSDLASSNSVQKGKYRDKAEALMKQIEEKNHENKAINLILEYAVGKVEKVFTSMIRLYEPAILIVGTRGRSLGGFQGLLPGSISKFCLQNSPVPVIVVRPNNQRARGKRKRQQDPTRHGYRDLLDKTGPDGGHLLDVSNRNSLSLEGMPILGDESSAVAAAMSGIGAIRLEPETKGSPLAQVQSTVSDVASPDSDIEASPEGGRVMKSPQLENLESPELSPDDDEDEDEDTEDPGSRELVRNHSRGVQLPQSEVNGSEQETAENRTEGHPA